MSRIAIVTDSDSSLPPEVAAQHHIRQVPITINFGQQSFETGLEIDDAQVFARIDREGKLPTTAAPAPGKFLEAYQEAFDHGAEAVLCFCVSSEVSGTYGAATTARDMLPERDITVVDSRSLSMAQGFAAIAAAEAAQAGASKDEALARAQDVVGRSRLYVALPTLKYLAMSGRVGHLAAGMAGLLNIKPILTIRDGKLVMLERVRTQGKAWARVIELVTEAAANQPIEQMAIIHANAATEARQLEEQLRSHLACPEQIVHAGITPGLSVHAGAGLVGTVMVVGKG